MLKSSVEKQKRTFIKNRGECSKRKVKTLVMIKLSPTKKTDVKPKLIFEWPEYVEDYYSSSHKLAGKLPNNNLTKWKR